MEGCLSFRQQIIKFSTQLNVNKPVVDPFRVAITLASMCSFIFRRYVLIPKTIAIIPSNGYNMNQNTSIKSRYWLMHIAKQNNIDINHARNGGEYKIGDYYLDGYCKENKTFYEFDGCYWHGCLKSFDSNNNESGCYSKSSWNGIKQQTMLECNVRHNKRLKTINKMSIITS